jgi:hypothetical protein
VCTPWCAATSVTTHTTDTPGACATHTSWGVEPLGVPTPWAQHHHHSPIIGRCGCWASPYQRATPHACCPQRENSSLRGAGGFTGAGFTVTGRPPAAAGFTAGLAGTGLGAAPAGLAAAERTTTALATTGRATSLATGRAATGLGTLAAGRLGTTTTAATLGAGTPAAGRLAGTTVGPRCAGAGLATGGLTATAGLTAGPLAAAAGLPGTMVRGAVLVTACGVVVVVLVVAVAVAAPGRLLAAADLAEGLAGAPDSRPCCPTSTAEVRFSRWDHSSVVEALRAALPGARGLRADRSAQSDCAHTQLTWMIYLGRDGGGSGGGQTGRRGGGRQQGGGGEQQVYRGFQQPKAAMSLVPAGGAQQTFR